jgi:hypothetical protein
MTDRHRLIAMIFVRAKGKSIESESFPELGSRGVALGVRVRPQGQLISVSSSDGLLAFVGLRLKSFSFRVAT